MANMQIGWVLLLVGFAPWRVSWRRVNKRQRRRTAQWRSLQVEAVFWRLSVEHSPQGVTWRLSLPLIVRLKAAIWSALRDLIKG